MSKTEHTNTEPGECQGVVGFSCPRCGSFTPDDSPTGVRASNMNADAMNARDFYDRGGD
jgi:hypothetical protein